MKKITLLLWIGSFLLPLTVFAQKPPQLTSLLVHSSAQTQDRLLFVLTGDNPASISELRMHFLTGADCYSGYLQGYRSAADAPPFLLRKDQPFSLTGEGIYQVAQSVLGAESVSDIHAILIRFLDRTHGQRYQQFARFTGSCQDQEINCCIPVDCSHSAGVCTAKYDLGVQSIVWYKVS